MKNQFRIIFRDTTLREGIQMPGSRISLEQKRQFLMLLEDIGVPEIEIGLPDGVAACLDVARIAQESAPALKATALIPCYTDRWRRHIDLAAENGLHRIDVLTPVSDFLLSDPSLYGMTSSEILPRILAVIDYAARTGLEISVGLMDATRTEVERILGIVSSLRNCGVSRLVVYDSVGIMTPSRMIPFIARICEASMLPVLVHCHNDYGMATANALAAVEAGAVAIDVAVNGVGGRAGNTPFEEVSMALENLYGTATGIKTSLICRLSDLVQEMTGVRNSPVKPVVGSFCFAHLPVMHIRCIAAGHSSAFEPYPPEQVGTFRTYHFSLPVDYSAAIAPFIRKSGIELSADQTQKLLASLQRREGWTEDEVIKLIAEIRDTQPR